MESEYLVQYKKGRNCEAGSFDWFMEIKTSVVGGKLLYPEMLSAGMKDDIIK